jgi:gas vesicle protein
LAKSAKQLHHLRNDKGVIMNKTLSFLVAAAGGFVAGVLLAPKSGKETRQELKEKAMDYKGKANDGLDEAKKGARVVKGELNVGTAVNNRDDGTAVNNK